jgi:uncharacterized protein YpiB (UPF0302 family)
MIFLNITVDEKKDFIHWFLNHYSLKRREAVWILNYLISHESILDNLHFVEDVKDCPRGIMMSTHCVDKPPFRFYLNGEEKTDAEYAFHNIRLNREETLYIQFNFKDALQIEQHVSILEENPYDKKTVSEDDSLEAEAFLNHCLTVGEKNRMLHQIDDSLIQGDEKLFIELTSEYLTFLNKEKK